MDIKGYYFDKAKQKFIVRFVKDGKRVHVGSFKTEDEAKLAVAESRNKTSHDKDIDMAKKKTTPKNKIKTTADALAFLEKQKYKPKSLSLYTANLEKICKHFETENLDNMLSDPKKFFEKLRMMTYENDENKLVSPESIKSYLTLIRELTKDNQVPSVDEAKVKIYNNEMLRYAKLTEHERGKNRKKGNLAKHSEVDWTWILRKRDEFEKSRYMTEEQIRHFALISLITMRVEVTRRPFAISDGMHNTK
jgi:arsenate reductase-like glutaredoxin family protein